MTLAILHLGTLDLTKISITTTATVATKEVRTFKTRITQEMIDMANLPEAAKAALKKRAKENDGFFTSNELKDAIVGAIEGSNTDPLDEQVLDIRAAEAQLPTQQEVIVSVPQTVRQSVPISPPRIQTPILPVLPSPSPP